MTKHLRLTDEAYRALKGLVTGGVNAPGLRVGRSKGNIHSSRLASKRALKDGGSQVRNLAPSPPFTFTLLGQIPSGKNSIKTTRTGKRYPTKRFVAWRDEAVSTVREWLKAANPYVRGALFVKPSTLCIEIRYAAGDLRRRDMPGMMDALYHVLEKAQIVEDDAQIQECHWYQLPLNREQPSVTVTLKEKA